MPDLGKIDRLLGGEGAHVRSDVWRFAIRWPAFAVLLEAVFTLLGDTQEDVATAVGAILVGAACYPALWVRVS